MEKLRRDGFFSVGFQAVDFTCRTLESNHPEVFRGSKDDVGHRPTSERLKAIEEQYNSMLWVASEAEAAGFALLERMEVDRFVTFYKMKREQLRKRNAQKK